MTSTPTAQPAHSVDNERAVLALAMNSPDLLPRLSAQLSLGDFWQPRHQEVWAAMLDLVEAGTLTDPVTVLNALTLRGTLRSAGGASYLGELYAVPAAAVNADGYAAKLRECTRVRELDRALATLVQARTELAGDPDELFAQVARQTIALELAVDGDALARSVGGLSTLDAFLARPDTPADFLVPGLIERQDVWMLLAGEGVGKSWLLRQFATTVAAGLHPFKASTRIAPRRTLLVDLENPDALLRRQVRPVLSQLVRSLPPAPAGWDSDRCWIWHRPEGLNLRQHADAALLERVVAEARPELICFGPLYKAYARGHDDWDTATDEVRVVFDRIRARYGVAFVLEHHMPKGDGKSRPALPFGSSVWQRWAGFGRVLSQVGPSMYALEASFRNDRDVREVPVGLVRGGALPWSPVWDVEELDFGRWPRSREGSRP